MDKRKELKEVYKNTRTEMGVFIIKSNTARKCLIEATVDLKSAINSTRFQLDFGSYPNRQLQECWKRDGASAHTIEVLEKLAYDEDGSKTDYSEELNILKMLVCEQLAKDGMEFFKR